MKLKTGTKALISDSDKMSHDVTLILDTSAVICLHQSKHGEEIVEALPNKIIIPQYVRNELLVAKSLKYKTDEFVDQIVSNNSAEVIEPSFREIELHEQLTSSQSKQAIGSGEASVIALAKTRYTNDNCIPIIDDGKGRDVAKVVLGGKESGYSLDIFINPAVNSNLSVEDASNALFFAIRYGRMTIQDCCLQQVIELIGEESARKCQSLPGYKQLFGKPN